MRYIRQKAMHHLDEWTSRIKGGPAGDWAGLRAGFFVSTGRTGTDFLARFFAAARAGVASRHQPEPDLYDIGMDYALGRIDDNEAAKMIAYSRAYVARELKRNGIDYFIESNNNLGYVIPLLRRVYPDYRIVHIVRDGRAYVRSAYSRRAPHKYIKGETALILTPEDIRERLRADKFPEDPYFSRWEGMSRFERLCWLWTKMDGMIQDAMKNEPRALVVKFEDIFDKDADYPGMHQIIDFLGLRDRIQLSPEELRGIMARPANESREFVLPHWRDWTPEQSGQFKSIAGAHMSRCGYEF